MASTMTPSTITDEQIEKAVATFRAALVKRQAEFGSDPAQAALGTPNLGARLLAPFKELVEANSNQIVRIVTVNATRDGRAALDATGRVLYVSVAVVKAMPRGEGGTTEVVFFNVGRYVTDAELDTEYELRGLTPADPFSIAAVNEADPTFADDRPNATHWKDANGKWFYAAFYRWDDERSVNVDRDDGDWSDGDWSFAGVRKST